MGKTVDEAGGEEGHLTRSTRPPGQRGGFKNPLSERSMCALEVSKASTSTATLTIP